jgi:hypothetical protein
MTPNDLHHPPQKSNRSLYIDEVNPKKPGAISNGTTGGSPTSNFIFHDDGKKLPVSQS